MMIATISKERLSGLSKRAIWKSMSEEVLNKQQANLELRSEMNPQALGLEKTKNQW